MGLRAKWQALDSTAKLLVALGLVPVVFIVGTVVLSVVIATVVLTFGSGAETAATPQADWGFNYTATNASSGELTITHEGGESVDAGPLAIEVGSRTLDWGTEGTVSVGDTTTITVQPDESVVLVWTGGDAESVLDDWDGPDA